MKVYVGNLPFTVDDDKLKELFSSYGEIEEVTVIKDKFSGRSKGFGFVTFKDDESAKKAIAEMNDKEVEGRKLVFSVEANDGVDLISKGLHERFIIDKDKFDATANEKTKFLL